MIKWRRVERMWINERRIEGIGALGLWFRIGVLGLIPPQERPRSGDLAGKEIRCR